MNRSEHGLSSGWGTRLGFYLAAIGSAFGLGNLWRFPYVVAENGGGAFVLLYIALVFLIGMPFLIGELILGKTSRRSVLPALSFMKQSAGEVEVSPHLEPSNTSKQKNYLKRFSAVGYITVFICMVVMAYYAVISGWVLHFLIRSVADFFVSFHGPPGQSLDFLLANGWLQIGLAGLHLGIVLVVVGKDVEEGIERAVGYMMPVFVLLLIGLAVKSLSLQSAPDALRFLLYPDFSKLKASSLGQALGHVFFTLSVGFGIMVTFGSYMRKKSYIPIAGFRVATFDSLISLFAGVMIFPLVFVISKPMSGPEILFQTLPIFFDNLPGGQWFSLAFFLCLYLAALSASIGLLETVVANTQQSLGLSRFQAAWIGGILCFLFAILPALSSSVFKDVNFGERSLLQVLDFALINWLLPISALILSQIVCYRLSEKVKRQEFMDEESEISIKLYSHWLFVLRWVAAPVILFALGLQVYSLF